MGKVTRKLVLSLLAFQFNAITAPAVIVYDESWNASDAGWTHRISGQMSMTFSQTNSPDGGALAGIFSSINYPTPDFDVFRVEGEASGGHFGGNYWSENGQVPFCLSFDFLALDERPSSLLLRFCGSSGGFTSVFFTALSDQADQVGTWQRIRAPLQFSSSAWVGGTREDFSNALRNVQWIEVQVCRNGTSPQTFVIDHFTSVNLPPAD